MSVFSSSPLEIVLHRTLFVALVLVISKVTVADDWPMWRCDATRSAASSNTVPSELELIWSKQLSPRKQAWDDPLNLDLMTYDRVFEPIVMNGRMFVGFNDTDKLLAIDATTGKKLWAFYAEAPVRLAPVAWNGSVYFCSDDGFLYCVDAESGTLRWKFRGAPGSQHAIGNQRITSAWPARGGPVIRDGTVYFAASIWPFMGTFLYALNAETGGVEWVNDTTGSQYIKQPHSAPSFAGVAPQGALVATQNRLLVPGGRSVPAVFDRSDGALKYFEINAGGKGTGGSFVTADEQHFYVHTRLKGTRAFRLSDGVKTAFMPSEPVLAGDRIYSAETEGEAPVLRAYDRTQNLLWELPVDGRGDLILAGDQLIAAGETGITLVKLDASTQPPNEIRRKPVPDVSIQRLIAANEMLFAVTLDGQILAFGDTALHAQAAESVNAVSAKEQIETASKQDTSDAAAGIVVTDQTRSLARRLLRACDAEGYAFWYGSWNNPVLRSLTIDSPFRQLAVVSPDSSDVAEMRRQLDQRQLYGRVTAHHSFASKFAAPRYVANFVCVDMDSLAGQFDLSELPKLYESVRPYGGVMCVLSRSSSPRLLSQIQSMNLEQAEIVASPFGVVIKRVGALPGSASWTHQYGNVANTLKSDDQRVKLPLGVLWFGGSSNMDVLPRHGHGPPEQVIGGRLFIQGMNSLSARDVYTGRVLWKREFEDLGTFDVYYDNTYEDTPLNPKYNQVHIPGANARGTNYVATEDRVYVVEGPVCHAMDPSTGKTVHQFRIPATESGDQPEWGYIGVYKDVLIGGVGFANYRRRHDLSFPEDKDLSRSRAGFGTKSLDRAASAGLVGFDRHTGKQLWRINANHSFWHNGIVAGGDRIYCLDRNPKKIEDAMRRRGLPQPDTYRIAAFDYRTGQSTWEVREGIFGTWLGYSAKHDLLLQAGAKASDRLYDEVDRGMAAYEGRTGAVAWKNEDRRYSGPCILHNDLIITNANSYSRSAGAFHLVDGSPKLVANPLTGEMQPWLITRAYGCNSIIASENLLTFRSGAAGFYDLTSNSGTGNLGGFKSGCTSNLVVADGILNAPDYTRTCSCAYQNQTSLGLVHMPEVELWSVNSAASLLTEGKRIRQLGINFGAPGDRRDQEGLLWIEYPAVAGASPPVNIEMNSGARFFHRHSSTMAQTAKPWVFASGVQGVTDLRIKMDIAAASGKNRGIAIAHVDDDAEENEAGDVNLRSSDLELVEDGQSQVIGLRFEGVKLTPDAKIREAYLQFTCDETSSKPTGLIVAAEATGNAARFGEDRHDVSSRDRTTAEIAWDPAAWTKKFESNEKHRTPDISALLREVIQHPDWKPGNAVGFLISGTGKRVAVAGKPNDPHSPRLVIDFESTDANEIPTTPAQRYTVELHLTAQAKLDDQPIVFSVSIDGNPVAKDITMAPDETGQVYRVHRLLNVPIRDQLHLQIRAKRGEPALAGISIHQETSESDD